MRTDRSGIRNPLSYLQPKNWAVGLTLLLSATVVAARDLMAPRAAPARRLTALAPAPWVPAPSPSLAPCRAPAVRPRGPGLAPDNVLSISALRLAPAPAGDLTDPFTRATEAQGADLMGCTRGAPAFNVDAAGQPVIAASDVHQDILHEGDCQTMSVLASVAHANPELLKGNVISLGQDPDGSTRYGVKLFVNQKWTTVAVTDADLPGLGALQTTDVIWPRLVEAALIKAFPTYDLLNQNAVDPSVPPTHRVPMDTASVLYAVTGGALRKGEDSATDELLGAVALGQPATAGTAKGYLGTFGHYQTVDAQSGTPASPGAANAVTILGAHQYAVLGASGQAPNRQVTLFNPYNYPGRGGSTFTVSETVFGSLFSSNLAWLRSAK